MEVAGIVLGAIPILYGAIEMYKDTIQTGKLFFRKRKYVEKLANSLFFHKGTLTEVVRQLLIGSGCDSVTDLDEDPFGYLNDEDIQKQLHEYLGSEIESAFTNALQQACHTVEKIAKSIGGLVPGLEVCWINFAVTNCSDCSVNSSFYIQEPTGDLREIIQTNKAQKSKQIDFAPRVKLMFGAADIKNAISELDTTMNGLCRLSNLVSSNRQPLTEKSSRNANKLARGFRRLQALANNLHEAISYSWKGGCHIKHDAKLYLDDRLEAAINISTRTRKVDSEPKLTFRLIFEARELHDKALWHETTVHVIDDPNDDLDPAPSTQMPGACRVTIVIPKAMVTRNDITMIDDICAVIKATQSSQDQVSFVLHGNHRIGSIPSGKKAPPCYFHGNETSLKTILLSDSKPGHRGSLIPLGLRMLLALRVASNLLQLFKTQWLQHAWSKDTIYFPVSATAGMPDFGRPFVSIPFEDSSRDPESGKNLELRIAILELGILLLEIWHEKAFEDQYNTITQTPVTRHIRRALALDWVEDASNPPPTLYYNAVLYCISGIINGESRDWEWDDRRLWSSLCQNIIEPLSKNCQSWSGLTGGQRLI
ncbi:hypothetical protein ABW19_dt0206299 [Dactylella cylindrospora]|nr:hypothetical protein ABW19_dt0206299 [Dactylella cylindrospora]